MSKLSVPESKKSAMILLLACILGVCVLWIGYQLLASGPGVPTAGTRPDTPEFRELMELNEKLRADERFNTLEAFKNDEGKWVCAGALRKASDESALKAKLAELKPDAEWVLDLSFMGP